MTTFRTNAMTGAVGAVGSAAAIGMDSISGTIEYVTPGWKDDTAVKYSAEAVATLTDTITAHVWEEKTVQFEEFPSVETTIEQWRKADLGVVCAIKVTTTGHFLLVGSGASETTVGEYRGKWIKYVVDFNQDDKEVVVRFYDRAENYLETLRAPIGQQPITTYREGPLTTGTDMHLLVAGPVTMRDLVPIYQPLDRPNIVYIVLDDAPAQAYLLHMSSVLDMAVVGALLANNFECSPLCAPSRANMISGLYGQHNGVLGNGGATNAFRAIAGNERRAIYTRMSDLGYRTNHIGKWLHNYDVNGQSGANPTDPLWKPQGIDWAFITSEGYDPFEYEATQNRDGTATLVDTTGGDAEELDFLTDVIAEHGVDFITDHFNRYPDTPLFQFVALFSGHNNTGSTDPEDGGGYTVKFPPAPRDRRDSINRAAVEASEGWAPLDPLLIPDGDLGDDPPAGAQDYYWNDQAANWNTHPDPLPGWHNTGVLTTELAEYDAQYLDVVRQMQAANDAIASIRAAILAEGGAGALANTVFIVTSDNGYHRGEFGLPTGKGTPYDPDCRLPVVVAGPGVTEGISVSALTQPIDLLPTCLEIAGIPADQNGVTADDVDGFSWWGHVTGGTIPQDAQRQTALMQYVSGDVDSWEDAYGTGEPPDWYALRNTEALFVTFDTDNQAPPDSDRAEAYSTATDPGMVANLFPTMPAYRGWPVMAILQSLLTSEQGAETRAAQLQRFSLGVGSDAILGTPVHVIEGVDLMDPAGRWFEVGGTSLPSVPEPSLPSFGTLGDGVMVNGDAYDETVTIGSAFGQLNVLVLDLDEQGRNGGSFQVGANVSAVLAPVVRRGIWTLGERPSAGLPVQWEARARRAGTVPQEMLDPSTRGLSIPYEQVDGTWHSPLAYTWTVNPWKGTNPGSYHIYTLAGSQAPVVPLIRIAGPIHVMTGEDIATRVNGVEGTGHVMTWDGADFGDISDPYVEAGQWLLIDCERWIALRKTTDDWDFTTGDDVSAGLDSNSGQPLLWRLQPVIYGGDPFDMRIYANFTGTAREDTTQLQVRAHKTRYA